MGKSTIGIINIGDAAAHPGCEIAPCLAQHHHDTAGHIFAGMVACALDHGNRARIANGKAFTRDAAKILA